MRVFVTGATGFIGSAIVQELMSAGHQVTGHRLQVPVVSIAPEEAANHFGWFAHFAAIDIPASSQKTRELLGWKPKQPGLIADLDREQYFKT